MSIEQDIRDLTVAIKNLTIALNNNQSKIPFENEPVIKILEEVAADLTVVPTAEPVIKLIAREELQSKCGALVRGNRALKPKLLEWLNTKNASSLAELESKYLNDFNEFVESIK